MNIRREYRSPNCTLLLEGFGDNSPTSNGLQSLSVVINAECHFLGLPNKLHGGRVFLENLAQSLNSYTQQLLSGITHPQNNSNTDESFSIEKIANIHRLTYIPSAQEQPITIDLNTVQLFDLVETMDQFLSDTRTLPELSPKIQPLARRYRTSEESTLKRMLPALVGSATLALTGFVVYLMPTPDLPKPHAQGRTSGLVMPKSTKPRPH